MLAQEFNQLRWKNYIKVGQTMPATVVAKEDGGYTLQLEGFTLLKGFLPSQKEVRVGQRLLGRFIGHADQKLVFAALCYADGNEPTRINQPCVNKPYVNKSKSLEMHYSAGQKQ